MVGIAVGALLFVAVIGEGAYIVRMRRQMETLSADVAQLRLAQDEDGSGSRDPRSSSWSRPGIGEIAVSGGAEPQGRLPPPKFVMPPQPIAPPPPGAPVPLPAALDSPQAREQLRQFFLAELQRERDQTRERARQRRDELEQERLNETVQRLGLNPDEARRFGQVVASTQEARRELRAKMESGQIARADVGRELSTLREKTDQQFRDVLGPDRMKQFEQLQTTGRGLMGFPQRRGGVSSGGPGFPGMSGAVPSMRTPGPTVP